MNSTQDVNYCAELSAVSSQQSAVSKSAVSKSAVSKSAVSKSAVIPGRSWLTVTADGSWRTADG
jgi:hypothetical protein